MNGSRAAGVIIQGEMVEPRDLELRGPRGYISKEPMSRAVGSQLAEHCVLVFPEESKWKGEAGRK